MSQHPLDSTVSALWQLVAEQEVMVMVILSNIDNEDYRYVRSWTLVMAMVFLSNKIKQYYEEYQNINAVLLMETQLRS